jgi:hypothetical protein
MNMRSALYTARRHLGAAQYSTAARLLKNDSQVLCPVADSGRTALPPLPLPLLLLLLLAVPWPPLPLLLLPMPLPLLLLEEEAVATVELVALPLLFFPRSNILALSFKLSAGGEGSAVGIVSSGGKSFMRLRDILQPCFRRYGLRMDTVQAPSEGIVLRFEGER